MRLTAILVVLMLTILGFWACQYSLDTDQKATNRAIHTSLKEIQSKDSFHTFIAEQGFNHLMPSGTEINIPGGALMKTNGELVNGKVELLISEYKDAIDLLIEGIPMNVDYGMAKTAGAFKLEAMQADEKLLLDPTKNIQIRLACYEKEEDYSLYYLNEKENHLDSLFQVTPEMNEEYIQLERTIRKMKPWIKFPLGEDHFAFSYKGILDVIYNENLTNVSHQMTKKKMQQYGLRWSNINVETFIDYNGKREPAALMVWSNISKKPLPSWVKEGNGSLEKIRKDRYRLIVQDSSGLKNFSTQIEPALSLKELFAFGPGFWKNDYSAKLKKIKNEEVYLHETPSTFRSFTINRFGTYNWLRLSDEIPSLDLRCRFKLNNTPFDKEEIAGVFYLSADVKGFTYYPTSNMEEIRFFDDPNARIFSISKQREILLFPLDQMSAIEYKQFEKMKEPSFIFKMEKQKTIPESSKELRSALQIIP